MRKYKFKIKKENERCLEYLVEDQKYLVEDHDPEEENIKFTIPLAFQVGRFAMLILVINLLVFQDQEDYHFFCKFIFWNSAAYIQVTSG